MSTNSSSILTITGSKSRLAKLARSLGATVSAHPRTGEPCVSVPVVEACPFRVAGSLPDGRVSAMRLESQAWEFMGDAAFVAAVRGWTPEVGERRMCAESARRMNRIRTILETDRRIA
jgi:hypothetical protein